MIKIAMFGLSNQFGGVERFITNVYQLLRDEDISFDFYILSEKIDYLELNSIRDSIIYITPRRSNYFRFCSDLKKQLNNNYDIMWYNCCTLSCFEPIVYAYKAGIKKIIVHSHNGENMGNSLTGILHKLNKIRLSRYATDYFSCSDRATQFMFPKKVRDHAKIIHNFIDSEKYYFNPELSRKIKHNLGVEDKYIIGHVGRFHPQKNHIFILEIFKEYLAYNPKAMLIFCGNGELFDKVKTKAIDLKINESVLFLGDVDNIQNIYQAFDLFLFPSLYEGLPFALIEAQAAGIPCLISDTISDQIRITNKVMSESLSSSVKQWAEDLVKISEIKKSNSRSDIEASGYSMKNYKQILMKYLNL